MRGCQLCKFTSVEPAGEGETCLLHTHKDETCSSLKIGYLTKNIWTCELQANRSSFASARRQRDNMWKKGSAQNFCRCR